MIQWKDVERQIRKSDNCSYHINRTNAHNIYIYTCIYIFIYIYLHPQSGSLFWPLSEKAPLENQRQILMGRGISLLSTIFTHQITRNQFLLKEMPITKEVHFLAPQAEKYLHINTLFHEKKVSTYPAVFFQSGSSRIYFLFDRGNNANKLSPSFTS